MANSSTIIDHTTADIWIVSKNSPNIDFGRTMPERFVHTVRSTPGVARAETLLFGWTGIKLPDGSSEKVEAIGFHPEAGPGWGGPWSFVDGGPRSVLGGPYMIVDESSEKRLGELAVGRRFELAGREMILRGITSGIRTITTSPYLFVSYDEAGKIIPDVRKKDTTFILVQAQPGSDIQKLKAELQARLPYVDVLTREEYSARTRWYWSIKTGVGLSFIMNAVLSLLVGLSIVGQVVYSDTLERQREYAILRALGATNTEVVGLLGLQALATSVIGYLCGAALALGVQQLFDLLYLTVALPQSLWIAVAAFTFFMCVGGSMTSIEKVMRLDPGMVFGGP
jgi:putative ABC transport system permease protein